MLGWVLSGLIGVVTAATVVAVVITIAGIISKKSIKKKFGAAVVNMVDNCTNTVTITALDDEKKYELHGDGIAADIHPGIIIS